MRTRELVALAVLFWLAFHRRPAGETSVGFSITEPDMLGLPVLY